jgi:hypothetical protein
LDVGFLRRKKRNRDRPGEHDNPGRKDVSDDRCHTPMLEPG